jgi:hypothetical protein
MLDGENLDPVVPELVNNTVASEKDLSEALVLESFYQCAGFWKEAQPFSRLP